MYASGAGPAVYATALTIAVTPMASAGHPSNATSRSPDNTATAIAMNAPRRTCDAASHPDWAARGGPTRSTSAPRMKSP